MTESCTWRLLRQIAKFYHVWRRNPKERREKVVNRANNCCRMCKCSFNVKYGTGKSGCMFTQNLYKASNRDGSHGEVLASMCENIGVIFMKSPSLSERVCHRAPAKSEICASYLLR